MPFATVGDSAFPPRSWLLKAFFDTAKDVAKKKLKLRAARVISEHAYGMLKGTWRIIYKKTECRRSNILMLLL